MKTSANCISFVRIILTFTLLLVPPLSIWYISIYLVCGITDILDGYVARKTNTVSSLGAKIDSFADLIMAVVVIFSLYPLIIAIIQTEVLIWVVLIAIIRLSSILIVLKKYKTFEILHTYGNKVTGFLLLLFPLTMFFAQTDIYVYLVCAIASLSALEELVSHISSSELQGAVSK